MFVVFTEKGSVESVRGSDLLSYNRIVLNFQHTVADEVGLPSNFDSDLVVLLNFECFHVEVFRVEKVIVVLHSAQLEIRFFEVVFATQVDLMEGQHERKHFGSF
jgi:hypothetical protein